jgi:uroporphyrinogen-III synthase
VILRPEPGASVTAARAAAQGLEVRRHPLFVPVAVPWTMPEGRFDALLVTSANAVRLAGRLPDVPVHAVGQASADAARRAGLEVLTIGNGGVEALLDLVSSIRVCCTSPARTASFPFRPKAADHVRHRLPDGRAAAARTGPARGCGCPRSFSCRGPAAGRNRRCARPGSDRGHQPGGGGLLRAGWARCEAAAEPNDTALLGLAAKLCEEQPR